MAKSIQVNPKKRGRPKTTGRGQLIGIRLHKPLLTALDAWIADQESSPSRPEAIRRVLEQALPTASLSGPAKSGSRRKAAELAGQAIDSLGDQTTTDEERARRKRRLIKGPREFREVRGDQPKAKK
jgi:hypothetical protein